MRRIEFLAPVEDMRGNLSGSQRLTYPTQNNSAWESPSDKRNYATNYSTRYIGNKRSSDGKKFFSVKTRTAVTMSPKMREQQAMLSMSWMMANSISLKIDTLSQLQQLFLTYRKEGQSFKRWLQDRVRIALQTKRSAITFDESGAPSVVYANPFAISIPDQAHQVFYYGEGTPTNDLRKVFKFWEELGPTGAIKLPVTVNGSTCYILANPNVTFVTNYGYTRPSSWLGGPENFFVFTSNGITITRLNVSSSPEQTSVTIVSPSDLAVLTLYRRPKEAPETEDVVVDSVTDSPEEGYIYTFKKA